MRSALLLGWEVLLSKRSDEKLKCASHDSRQSPTHIRHPSGSATFVTFDRLQPVDIEALLTVKEILSRFAVQISQPHEFHDIQTAISGLCLGNPRMKHTQTFSHFPLCEPSSFPRTN